MATPVGKQRTPVTDITKVFHYTDTFNRKPTRINDPYEYMAGFGNRFESEYIPGTLPAGQIMPQQPRFGLYMEGITASWFMAPRRDNVSLYLYRARPSVAHGDFNAGFESRGDIESTFLSLNPRVKPIAPRIEWSPFKLPGPDEQIDFVDGLHSVAGSGDPNIREGVAQYVYMINKDMDHRAFCNADGDFLIVPQLGNLDVQTELGLLFVQPGEFCVIPRGVRFTIRLAAGSEHGRGNVTEIWGSRWELPELGPLGTHGLANSRDFLHPVAHIDENLHEDWSIVHKGNGVLNLLKQDHSPYDVVAWSGNHVPYKYDLTKFCTANATTVDHTDPSIYCVLTARSRDPSTALVEFLKLGPRWDVASNTFRQPYFHRNSASEYYSMIWGGAPDDSSCASNGAAWLEVGHTPHGAMSEGAIQERNNLVNEPRIILPNMLGFMVETSRNLLVADYALNKSGTLIPQEAQNWDHLSDHFSSAPNIKEIIQSAKEERRRRIQQLDSITNRD